MFDQYCAGEYRKDIQGLRALGAILIMVFHIWLHKVSGGVDVFFVVSGFMMASLLLKGFFKQGVVNPLVFWGGIVKRVAPSAYLVLGVTLLASYLLISPSFLMATTTEIIASVLHIENLQLMRDSVDYLAADVPDSPVQQFWALSIQVQFYAVLPFILLSLAWASRKLNTSAPLFIGVPLIIVASFIYAVIVVAENPSLHYFDPLARAWEFFTGVLVFLVVCNLNFVKYRSLLGLSGLLLVIGGAFLIPKGASFAGMVSLIPVLGAACILVSGSKGAGLANRLLSTRGLVYLGGVSFTIYLWHWPLYVFYQTYFDINSVAIVPGLAIMALAILLAIATSKLVEAPFKKIPREKVLVNFAIGILFFSPVMASAYLLRNDILATYDKATEQWVKQDVEPYHQTRIFPEKTPNAIEEEELFAARGVFPEPYNTNCQQSVHGTAVKTCRFGAVDADRKVVLVGGSHALQWLTALRAIAKDNNFEIVNMIKSSCPLGVVEESNASCRVWNEKAMAAIVEMQPDVVITNSTRTTEDEGEYLPESYVDSWKALAAHGIKVVGIRDNPRFEYDVPDCLYKHQQASANSCSLDRNEVFQAENPAVEHEDLIANIDMSDLLCTETRCPTRFKGYLMYRDDHHVHLPYVKFLRENVEKQLKGALPDVFDTAIVRAVAEKSALMVSRQKRPASKIRGS
nr:acyltransferase family protein [uncultured Halomonas sp.]